MTACPLTAPDVPITEGALTWIYLVTRPNDPPILCWCGATFGKPCRTRSGKPTADHKRRA